MYFIGIELMFLGIFVCSSCSDCSGKWAAFCVLALGTIIMAMGILINILGIMQI